MTTTCFLTILHTSEIYYKKFTFNRLLIAILLYTVSRAASVFSSEQNLHDREIYRQPVRFPFSAKTREIFPSRERKRKERKKKIKSTVNYTTKPGTHEDH